MLVMPSFIAAVGGWTLFIFLLAHSMSLFLQMTKKCFTFGARCVIITIVYTGVFVA